MPRRSPRVVLLWLGASALAIVTALIVASDLASLHRRAGSLGAPRAVALAASDLPVGTVVEAGDLRTRAVHRSQLPEGVVTPSDARDRVVAIAVARGALVMERNLAPRRRTGLDGAIPRGMRALRIVVRDSIRPRAGSAVDVLVTFDGTVVEAPVAERPGDGDGASVVARGVLVLGTDDDPAAVDAGDVATGDGLGVTLLVTQHESEELAAASATGVVTLALVPPEDAAPTP